MRSANKQSSLLVCSQTTGYVAKPLLYAMLLIYSQTIDIRHAMHLGDGVSSAPRQRREKRGPNSNTNFNTCLPISAKRSIFILLLLSEDFSMKGQEYTLKFIESNSHTLSDGRSIGIWHSDRPQCLREFCKRKPNLFLDILQD